ncbi:MAG: hypothetical protein KDD25_03665, partial [Bdellovibrionales bacterium]|nr:hypothetical protein [Bdellovibrionales bacterium]
MSENRTGGSPFFLMILLSLMIHLGAWKLAELVPESKPQEPSGEWINVSFRESPKTIILPDQMQNKKDDGKSVPLTSKNRNRVHQQSIAPMFGDTANRGGVKKQNKIDVKPRPIRMADESDVTVPKTLSLDPGPSTVTTTIDGVNVGAITALDTDAADIRYYTFFSRIIPQLRPRWERALLFAARNQLMLTSSSQVTKDWATVVDFYLDKEGKLVHST